MFAHIRSILAIGALIALAFWVSGLAAPVRTIEPVVAEGPQTLWGEGQDTGGAAHAGPLEGSGPLGGGVFGPQEPRGGDSHQAHGGEPFAGGGAGPPGEQGHDSWEADSDQGRSPEPLALSQAPQEEGPGDEEIQPLSGQEPLPQSGSSGGVGIPAEPEEPVCPEDPVSLEGDPGWRPCPGGPEDVAGGGYAVEEPGAGGALASPPPAPEAAVPAEAEEVEPQPEPQVPPEAVPQLPVTGGAVGLVAALGAGSVVLGLGLRAAARRR